jgi:hypothetical protein
MKCPRINGRSANLRCDYPNFTLGRILSTKTHGKFSTFTPFNLLSTSWRLSGFEGTLWQIYCFGDFRVFNLSRRRDREEKNLKTRLNICATGMSFAF